MAFADSILDSVASRAIAISFLLLPLFLLPCSAQDFDWSWEKEPETEPPVKVGTPVRTKQDTSVDKPVKPVGGEADFKWSWDGGASSAAPEPTPGTKPPAAQPRVRDDEAYQKLLKENLKLRREIAEAMKDGELAKKESARLGAQIKGMEASLSQSVSIIKNLKTTQNNAISPDQFNELEVRLATAEKAKETLAAELDRLKRMRDKAAEDQKQSATSGVAPGSDLFQEREKENVMLKRRLVEIESERRRLASEAAEAKTDAEKASQEAAKAKSELQAVSEKAVVAARQGAHYKKIVDKIPEIEDQVTQLRSNVAQKDQKLSAREEQLEAMMVELDRREHRLAKAQRMADLLERTRAEVLQANNREKLDMHYNMAVIYAKEGRFRDAESEYLKALRIDPTDADIHYNLGILYDQDLKQAKKAINHYRRYLTIRPSASDVDQVKSWIMELDLQN